MKILSCLLLLTLGVLPALADSFDLKEHGRLSATLPKTWTAKTEATEQGFDITLESTGEVNAMGRITVLFPAEGQLETREQVRTETRQICAQMEDGSVEGKTVLKDFSLRHGYGAYSTFTDKNLVGKPPVKGDYKIMSSGLIRLASGVVAIVSIFSDELAGDDYKQLLHIIESLELNPSRNTRLDA